MLEKEEEKEKGNAPNNIAATEDEEVKTDADQASTAEDD